MNKFNISKEIWRKTVDLTGSMTSVAFTGGIHELINEVARVNHYAVHTFDISRLNEPRLALFGGNISDYWARLATRQAADYARQRGEIFDTRLEELAKGVLEPGGLYRFTPDPEQHPEIFKLYKEDNTLEKVYDLRIDGGRLYQLNLYRSLTFGPFSADEIFRLEQIVPLATNLVRLRFQICGVDEQQKQNKKHAISHLQEKGTPCFTTLTGQETEVCDLIVYGLTTEGIAAEMDLSLSSVKTYRNRAYKKLQISSKSELFAMIINSQIL